MSARHATDERGAIAVVTVFMAVFALAILYSFVGTTESIFFRERMQDAADSAALSTAVIHARSMNFIVLINIIMACLLAILIAIKLMEGFCIIGIIVAAALAWPTFGATLVFIPPLKTAQSLMQQAYDDLKPPIDQALEILNQTAGIVQTTAPVVATALVSAEIKSEWAPPVEAGYAAGSRSDLPVENDDFKELCRKGGEQVGHVMTIPLEPFGPIADELSSALGSMTAALQGWFCGGGSSGPPSFKHDDTRVFPRIEATERCEAATRYDADCANAGEDCKQRQDDDDACEESRAFEEQSTPEPHTGQCQETMDCGTGGAYERRVALAREQCDPSGESPPVLYWYETRDGSVDYRWDGKIWKRGEPRFGKPKAYPPDIKSPPLDAHVPPCGPKSVNPKIAVGYNETVRFSNDVDDVLPVCSSDPGPPEFAPNLHDPTVVTREFTEVVHILGCKKRVTVEVSVGDDPPNEDGEDRSPKRVIEGVNLGDEDFRIRSLMHGAMGSDGAGRIVRLALHGRKRPEVPLAAFATLGEYSVAASEYFYNGAEGRDAWMWNMKWRARFRRFDVPEAESLSTFLVPCVATIGTDCPQAIGFVEGLGHVMAH